MRDIELDIIKQAILNEFEGAEFYRISASQFPDQEVKDAFEELAVEEEKHIKFLENLADKILGKNTFEAFDFEALEKEIESPGIFDKEKIDKQYASKAMTVFSIGLEMEKNSIKFYKEAKDKVDSEEAKKLFNLLVKWEESHLYEMSENYEMFKDMWWEEQRFSAF